MKEHLLPPNSQILIWHQIYLIKVTLYSTITNASSISVVNGRFIILRRGLKFLTVFFNAIYYFN